LLKSSFELLLPEFIKGLKALLSIATHRKLWVPLQGLPRGTWLSAFVLNLVLLKVLDIDLMRGVMVCACR
jgi:hypothetical protein